LVHIVDQGLAWYSGFVTGGKRLITVHDLIAYMTMQGQLDLRDLPRRRQWLVSKCVQYIRSADHLVSVSECTAGHLMSQLNIPASRISVVPNVIEANLYPLTPEQRTAARAEWFGDSEYVVVHVGKVTPYKNRIGALRAFGKLHVELPGARMFLVHGSPDSEECAFLRETPAASAITFLSPIKREDLRRFYGAADVLIFPSLYEGFGWPPLEAMACGCPVVCTTRGSLREVVGEAAVTVDDPHDHRLLAEAMARVLTEDSLSRDLRSRGLERVKRYAPEDRLREMADVYRLVCS
jgi:glycosyltransferase involved in cell wall biosynthesis